MAHRQYVRPRSRNRTGFFARWRSKLPKKTLPILLTVGAALFLFSAGTVLWWSKDLPNPQTIDERRVAESTKIFDRTGEVLLYEIGDIHRTVVPLENISRYIRQATLAAEDDQFYEHHGLDLQGIIRGVVLKPLTGQRAQGGSTITQQLIKNSILTPERTIQRKVKEAVLALELEQRFSKDEILMMYLNDIPYGSQAYGVEAAAKAYFDTPASGVSLAQAAILAALPQAPSYFSPYGSHFEDLKWRQEYILQRMADLDYVTQEEADAAKSEELEFEQQNESIRAPHFVFYVRELLDEQFGERVVEQSGLSIITTLDAELQEKGENILEEHTERLTGHGASNAALAAVSPQNGDILAMVGSLDYFNEDIDGNVNVTIRHRSPGSSIKPFVYAAAFRAGYTPETILVDAETDFGQEYRPKNYTLAQHGPVTMRQALANSLNIPAVKALYLAGVNESAALARAMGMESLDDPDRYGLSLVLGGGEVRLLDEVSAYGVFANDGVRVPHRAILKVVDQSGETLLDATEEDPDGEQVLDSQVARQITDVISDNASRALSFGTNTPLHLGTRPVAAKTGTTQDFRDGWTMGYTPTLAAGVWVGNNDNSPMGSRAAGANTAAPIWNQFMRGALANQPIEQFTRPEPIRDVSKPVLLGQLSETKARFDAETGLVNALECPVAIGEPKTFQELHSILFYVQRTNPRGSGPARAEADPQFDNWESAVSIWRDKHNEETKADPTKIYYTDSLPDPGCSVSDEGDLPKVTITEPATTVIDSSPVTVRVEVDTDKEIDNVRFLLDGEEITKRGKDETFEAQFSFPENFSGRKTLLVLATTTDKLIGRAHRTFIINPDDSPPDVIFHQPKNEEILQAESFPYTVKVTARDENGIELVDVLYVKDGADGTSRIGKTNQKSPTAPDRYEVVWQDSPGPGTYDIYVRAYDTTGNFTDSGRHRVEIR